MEDFSQSRGDDDLFDDEIIPIDPSQVETVTVTVPAQDISLENAPKGPSNNNIHRGHGLRGRGRGRGAYGRGNNELMNSRFAPKTQPPPPQLVSQSVSQPQIPAEDATPDATQQDVPPTIQPQAPTTDEDATTQLTEPSQTNVPATPSRPPAVRGDRTATGGVKKPKLTEDELTAKLAAAKQRSQNVSAAHARAEADAAAHQEREKVAQAKRVKDAVARKAMDTEREKNRARKMAGALGREWDEQKDPEEFSTRGRGRGNGFSRGARGADRRDPTFEDVDVDLRQYEWHDDRGKGRGRSRGVRGRGRGRGDYGGRGDHRSGNGAQLQQPNVSAEADFPALPERSKPTDDAALSAQQSRTKATSDVLSPTDGGGTWADQVESSQEAQ